jgi:hypothetical protein
MIAPSAFPVPQHITRDEASWLFNLETSADILDLLSWANRIREQFKGNKIHLCSIVNAKAGACSENCSFCAQSSHYQTGSPKYGFIEPEPVNEAADEANKNQVTAVGLVALEKGVAFHRAADFLREVERRQLQQPHCLLQARGQCLLLAVLLPELRLRHPSSSWDRPKVPFKPGCAQSARHPTLHQRERKERARKGYVCVKRI